MSPENNLLLRLHKWAWRQDENFLTEAFAHLLRYLLEKEPTAAVRILEVVTGGALKISPDAAPTVVVRTQRVTEQGRPDLEIETGKQRALIEVKSASGVDTEELVNYRKLLRGSDVLILLTRYFIAPENLSEQPNAYIRWSQVVEWLDDQHAKLTTPVGVHVLDQFLEFLRARNFAVSKVNSPIGPGIRAVGAYLNMLREAVAALKLVAEVFENGEWLGVKFKGLPEFACVAYESPGVLEYAAWVPVDPKAVEQVGIGSTFELKKSQVGWLHRLNLEAPELNFFEKPAAAQLKLFENFLRDCRETLKKIAIGGPSDVLGKGTEANASPAAVPGQSNELEP